MTQKLGNHFNVLEPKGLPLLKKCQPFYLVCLLFFFLKTLCIMIKLWFVPEILVFVREMSLKFDFGGRHACLYLRES